jgi:hypothetical protein
MMLLHERQELFSRGVQRACIRMGWMCNGLPVTSSGRSGSQGSTGALSAAIAVDRLHKPPASPAAASPVNSRRLRQQ